MPRTDRFESELRELHHERTEAALDTRRARAEASKLKGVASEQIAAGTAAEVREALAEEAAHSESIEEDHARLQEELGTLRFSLKDMKSFQHRRVQDLDNQVKRLERQRRRLEDEQAQRVRNEVASEAAEVTNNATTLLRLQQLNGRLTAQVQDAQQDDEGKQDKAAELSAERESLRAREQEQSHEFARAQEQLDTLSESEGALRRETRTLRNQAQLLVGQVNMLSKTASQTSIQLEEAEANHRRLREEEQATERRAEIIGWKLQIAETQLGRPPGRQRRGASSAVLSGAAGAAHGSASAIRDAVGASADASGASASSDSPAGAASGSLARGAPDAHAAAGPEMFLQPPRAPADASGTSAAAAALKPAAVEVHPSATSQQPERPP